MEKDVGALFQNGSGNDRSGNATELVELTFLSRVLTKPRGQGQDQMELPVWKGPIRNVFTVGRMAGISGRQAGAVFALCATG
jgi:hypothetical protein